MDLRARPLRARSTIDPSRTDSAGVICVARATIARRGNGLASILKQLPARPGYVAITFFLSRFSMISQRVLSVLVFASALIVSLGASLPRQALAAERFAQSASSSKLSEAEMTQAGFICDGPVTVNGTWYPEGLYPGSQWNCWASRATSCPPDGQVRTRYWETHYSDGTCSMSIECCYWRDGGGVAMN